MTKFTFNVSEEQSGAVTVEADNEKQARERVQEILECDGLEGFKDFNVKHREVLLIN